MRLTFTLPESSGAGALDVEIDHLVIAGWTGRDREAILHHIRELAELGVPQPSAIPLFYRVAVNQLSQNDCIEVGLFAGAAEISVKHNFGVRHPVRKTIVERTLKKILFICAESWMTLSHINGTVSISLMAP